MVFLIWSSPSIQKVCCCVCMLLTVIMNDCISFSGVLELLLDPNRLISFLDGCRRHCYCCCCCFNRVPFQDLSSHLRALFFKWNASDDGIVACNRFLVHWRSVWLYFSLCCGLLLLLHSSVLLHSTMGLLLTAFFFYLLHPSSATIIILSLFILSNCGFLLFRNFHLFFLPPDRNSFHFLWINQRYRSFPFNDHVVSRQTTKHEPDLYQELYPKVPSLWHEARFKYSIHPSMTLSHSCWIIWIFSIELFFSVPFIGNSIDPFFRWSIESKNSCSICTTLHRTDLLLVAKHDKILYPTLSVDCEVTPREVFFNLKIQWL